VVDGRAGGEHLDVEAHLGVQAAIELLGTNQRVQSLPHGTLP